MIPITATLTHKQAQAALGALLGAAVGDALGAPFEFRPAGLYAKRFPKAVLGGIGEMVGGGAFNWEPAEFTDDTQMAMALAESILSCRGDFEMETTWNHFVAWSKQATDIGNTTSASLGLHDFRTAAQEAHEAVGQSGGNGSVMRIAPIGIAGVLWGRARTMEIARLQSSLTHFDPMAGWAAAIAAEVIRACIAGEEFTRAVSEATQLVEDDHRDLFTEYLAESWTPDQSDITNGAAFVCLAQAVWAVRNTSSFEEAVVAAVNLGDDADTVAAVTGALAGAVYGIQQIPARWTTYVHGTVTQPDGSKKHYFQDDLMNIARQLVGKPVRPATPPEPSVKFGKVHEIGVYAGNLLGAPQADKNIAVVSLCRMEDRLHAHPYRREYYIIDKSQEGHNPHLRSIVEDAVASINAFLEEGREVLVHCHGGRSRTGFILKAWYMNKFNADHTTAEQWIIENWAESYPATNSDFVAFLVNDWE